MKALLKNINARNLLNIGLFIFILLLVLVVVMEPGKEPEKQIVHLSKLKQADIDHIELIRHNAGNITLVKQDGVWYLSKPYHLPANEFRARSVAALAEARSHLQYDANSMDLKKFQLAKPDITVILNDKLKLEIGGVDPLNNRRYVKNGNTLHLVNDTFYYQLIGQVTAYISYQLLPPESKLSKLVLPKFTLNQQDGIWQLAPAQKDTSADSLNEFVNEWRHAQSLEVSEYKGKPGKADILIYRENETDPIRFRLQKQQGTTYLVRDDIKLRYKLSDEIAEKLQTLPEPIEPADTEQTDSEKN